jgi:large subunit ribosomal protein L33
MHARRTTSVFASRHVERPSLTMGERISIALACTVCQSRNYRTTRARRVGAKGIELKKYCPKCNAHTLHKETK